MPQRIVIRDPSGKPIKYLNLREGADPAAAFAQYQKSQKPAAPDMSSPEMRAKVAAQEKRDAIEYDPTREMTKWEKFGMGSSAGVRRAGRGLMNMAGLLTDEETNSRNDLDKYIKNTPEGSVGDFIGNTAAVGLATAPLGGALGLAGKALMGAGKATLGVGSGVANTMAQGALGGAINANAGERGEGALLGGGIGGLAHGAVSGLGRVGRGLVKVNPNASALEQQLGTTIPLHMTVDTDTVSGKVAKLVYELAEATPFAGARLGRQARAAQDALVGKLGRESVPKSLGLNVDFTIGHTPAAQAANLANAKLVQETIDKTIAPIKSKLFTVGGRVWTNTVDVARAKAMKTNPQNMLAIQEVLDKAINPQLGVASGENLLKAIQGLKSLRNKVGGSSGTGMAEQIDDVIKGLEAFGDGVYGAGKLAPSWAASKKLLGDEYWAWAKFTKAVGNSNDGSLSPAALGAAFKIKPSSLIRGGMPDAQRTAQTGRLILQGKKSSGYPSWMRTLLGLGNVAGGVMSTMAAGPLGGAVAMGAVPLLAAKGTQKALVGNTGTQRALVKLLRNNPGLAAGLTAAATPEGN